MADIILGFLLWLNGVLIGALGAGVWIWWKLASGQRTIRSLDELASK